MTLGRVFDLGQITDKIVELNNKSLNMHTFITGSTGSGKSNTVYQMLSELHLDKIPFLVIEPAKGEYKDVFGNWDDVNVYSTNPDISELININPFKFPKSIHVLEHIDGLVEIFSVCWPMYDAMPAFFKDAILHAYETVGWDLGSSTFDGEKEEYPDFEILVEQLDNLINESDYASDIKSNYRGALVTRVRSLTVGLNKYIFTSKNATKKKGPWQPIACRNSVANKTMLSIDPRGTIIFDRHTRDAVNTQVNKTMVAEYDRNKKVFTLTFSKDKGFINVRTIASHANASFMGTFSSHGLALPKKSFRTECKIEGKTITFSIASLIAEQKASEKNKK